MSMKQDRGEPRAGEHTSLLVHTQVGFAASHLARGETPLFTDTVWTKLSPALIRTFSSGEVLWPILPSSTPSLAPHFDLIREK